MLVLRLACVVASSAALAAKRARAGSRSRRLRMMTCATATRVWPAGAKVGPPLAWDELAQRCMP